MDAIKGKYFSITDPKGVNTVIYKVKYFIFGKRNGI